MIRSLEARDMEQVLAIWLEASVAAHDFIDRSFWESQVTAMRDQYLPAADTFVYEDDNGVRGFVSLLGETLAALFVCPSAQGHGIGRKLLAHAIALRPRLSLSVYKANHKAAAFYTACGFRRTGERVDPHSGHVESLMERNG